MGVCSGWLGADIGAGVGGFERLGSKMAGGGGGGTSSSGGGGGAMMVALANSGSIGMWDMLLLPADETGVRDGLSSAA